VSSLDTLGPKSTSDQVGELLGSNAPGKYVVITGGSGGLGFDTAKVLCKHGADVMVTCRTEKQGGTVVQKLKAELGEDTKISFGVLDLTDLLSVKEFANNYLSSKRPLHVLINNAGVMACPLEKTKQGLELQFGVNVVGHFLLSKLLLPILSTSGTPELKSRVVNVSSLGNWLYGPEGAILWDDLSGDTHYDKWQRYGQSKLGNILFSNELNRQCVQKKQNVISVSLHPGVIMETDLMRHNSLLTAAADQIAYHWRSPAKLGAILMPVMKTTAQGAATQVRCALDPVIRPGKWYIDCQETTDYLHPLAFDEDIEKRLWNVCEELTKSYQS